MVDLSRMQEEVVIISEKGEDLITDEDQASVDGVFVKFIGSKESFSFDFCDFLVDFSFGLFAELEFHV